MIPQAILSQVEYVVGMAAFAMIRFKRNPLLASEDGARFESSSYFCNLNSLRVARCTADVISKLSNVPSFIEVDSFPCE